MVNYELRIADWVVRRANFQLVMGFLIEGNQALTGQEL